MTHLSLAILSAFAIDGILKSKFFSKKFLLVILIGIFSVILFDVSASPYPSYTEENFMKTPFIALTMGDMFDEAPGILTGLTVTVEDNTTWELDEGLQFPHYIKAACEFKYIGDSKLKTSGFHYDLLSEYREPLPQSVPISEGQEVAIEKPIVYP